MKTIYLFVIGTMLTITAMKADENCFCLKGDETKAQTYTESRDQCRNFCSKKGLDYSYVAW